MSPNKFSVPYCLSDLKKSAATLLSVEDKPQNQMDDGNQYRVNRISEEVFVKDTI